jgi:hypothetical protein
MVSVLVSSLVLLLHNAAFSVLVFVALIGQGSSLSHKQEAVVKSHSSEVYFIQHYVINFVSDLQQVGGISRYSSYLHQ